MTSNESPDTLAQWQLVGVSHRGSSHESSQLPCQDSAGYRLLDINGSGSQALVAAVSDGAGSAAVSHLGSRYAVNSSIATLATMLCLMEEREASSALPVALQAAMLDAHHDLEQLAATSGRDIGDFAATLLIAVVWGSVLAVAQVGDGSVVADHPDGGYFMATVPERGEYANETRFVTSVKNAQSPQVAVHENLDCRRLAMFSDGIQNLALNDSSGPNPSPFAPFFDRTFDWFLRQPDDLHAYTGLRRFLKSPNVRKRTDDDVTLLMAAR